MIKRQKLSKKLIFAIKFRLSMKDIFSKYEIICNDTNVTNLDIEAPDKIESLSFVDESRKIHKCMLSNIDFTNGTEYCCFWDRHPFTSTPIGCPIKYVPDIITRAYFSEISKDKFSVKESIVRDQEIAPDIDAKIELNNYYETIDVFCGFSCLLAFLQDPSTKRNPIYKDSELLCYRMHQRMYGNTKIVAASSWRVLKPYGGWLDIDSFRNNVLKVDHEFKGLYKPYFKSTAFAFEEKIKF